MRVSDLSQAESNGRVRISARFAWEDRAVPTRTMWFDFPAELGADVAVSPNVFLPSALGVALRDAERRVLIEGAVCPRLLEGLRSAAQLIASWFPHVEVPRLETTGGTRASVPRGTRAALCLSGGVDSLAALHANRETVPRDHVDSYRDGLWYFGLNTYDFDGESPRPERVAAYESHRQRLEQFGQIAGVRIIPVATNARTFAATWPDWDIGGLTPALVGGAHALPARIRSLAIAAAGVGVTPLTHSSHPLLDPHFSSFGLDTRVVGVTVSRFEKVRAIASWPDALNVLHVCLMFDVRPDGPPNCGQCEKCVRTMLELLLCGALEQASTFPTREVTEHSIRDISTAIANPLFYSECRDGLRALGRDDLVRAIDDRLAADQRPKSLLDRLFRR